MNLNKIKIKLEPLYEHTNDVYRKLFKDRSRYLILYGGAGSGKSHFIAQKHLFRILLGMSTGKRHKFLFLRKTQPAVRKSVFALFKNYIDLWNVGSLVNINKSEMSFEFSGGSSVICMGLDDPEKIKSIEGVTGVWVEEATEFTSEDVIQLDLRVRGHSDSYKQIVLSFNPISVVSWLYQRYFAPGALLDDCTVLRTTYKDNRFLDDQYVKVLEGLRAKDKTLHSIYALGEWGTLKGLIYTGWELTDEFPAFVRQVTYGVDFGFNHPSAIVKCGIYDDDYLFVDEIIYERGLTNTELIALADRLIEDKTPDMICDSAEPDRIKEFHQAGFNARPCVKGAHSVRHGIDRVKSFKKIYITKRSVNVLKEIQTYKWKEDKYGNPLDAPVEVFDDAMAAIRYAVGNGSDGDIKIRELDY